MRNRTGLSLSKDDDTLKFRYQRLAAPVIFAVALATRVIYILTAGWNYKAIFDAGIYDDIARNLLDHGCYCVHGSYASVSRAPLWPWILAAVYFISGKQVIFGQLFYALLGSGTCLFVYLLARFLFPGVIAVITGLLAATYSGLFLYDGWLYSESLYTFCFTGFVYTLVRLQHVYQGGAMVEGKNHSLRRHVSMMLNIWSVSSVLFMALAILTRPNGSVLLGMLCIWAVFLCVGHVVHRKGWQQLWQQVLLMCCLAIVLVLPWTYRNYQVSHQLVFVSTGLGEVLAGVYNDKVLQQPPANRGFWIPADGTKIHDSVGYTLADDQKSTRQALSWIAAHPDKLPELLALHFINTWRPYTYSHGLPIEEFPQRLSSKIVFIMIPIQTIAIYALALLGCIATWKTQRKELIPVYIAIAITIGQNMVFYGDMRFRAPMEPLLVLLAGAALWQIWLWLPHPQLLNT